MAYSNTVLSGLVNQTRQNTFFAQNIYDFLCVQMFELQDRVLPNPLNLNQLILTIPSPGSLSILITMLRHNMAAISEIGDVRTWSALFVVCSVILGLYTNSSIRESQGRNELHVCQRWRMKADDEEANFTRKEKEHYRFCVQIRYVFPLCR